MLLFGSAFTLLYFVYEIYEGIEIINSGRKGEGVGTFVDAGIFLFVSVYLIINVRKANTAVKKENAERETN